VARLAAPPHPRVCPPTRHARPLRGQWAYHPVEGRGSGARCRGGRARSIATRNWEGLSGRLRAADFARQDLQASTSAYIVSLHKRSTRRPDTNGTPGACYCRGRPYAHSGRGLPSFARNEHRQQANNMSSPPYGLWGAPYKVRLWAVGVKEQPLPTYSEFNESQEDAIRLIPTAVRSMRANSGRPSTYFSSAWAVWCRPFFAWPRPSGGWLAQAISIRLHKAP